MESGLCKTFSDHYYVYQTLLFEGGSTNGNNFLNKQWSCNNNKIVN